MKTQKPSSALLRVVMCGLVLMCSLVASVKAVHAQMIPVALHETLSTSPVPAALTSPPSPVRMRTAPPELEPEPLQPIAAPAQQTSPFACDTTVTANVVAFDQVYTYNRYGAFNPAGMMYALKRDVIPINGGVATAGNVQLRKNKRPRPIVLRVNEGDCLEVTFTNLLNPNRPNNNSTATRAASMHVNGLDYLRSIDDDGANVGKNPTSLAEPNETRIYKWFAKKQGQYMLFSMGAPAGGEGDLGQGGLGLFGIVNVEPTGSKWYRSQVTAEELKAVTQATRNDNKTPRINYEQTDASGVPILNILMGNEIVHTDLNALITGVNDQNDGCVNSAGKRIAPPSSTCGRNFREFSVLFHDEIKAVQAFQALEDNDLFHGVRDGFAVNYGASGLGAIVLANRAGIGPNADCEECKFEDFFLTSWTQGDPALLVTKNAVTGQKFVPYPDDPSNVHHSYLNDPVRMRNIHIGKETHVFHLHAHQWLQTPRDENSTYLDSQTISPGASYTYEINYGGSGNRNLTPGDSIFHCHLYPHFAQGMWELWRVHDVFEQGTVDRNLPDAEIAGGTPTPAIVPLPDRGMPPMPTPAFKGFPFYIPAIAGKRPPQPPLDFDVDGGIIRDGGLPRHLILHADIIDGQAAIEPQLLNDPVAARVLQQNPNNPNLLAFARKLIKAEIKLLPFDGTLTEQQAMAFHEAANQPLVYDDLRRRNIRAYSSFTPTGAPAPFFVNGQPRIAGAPFADPCLPNTPTRLYRAAAIQMGTDGRNQDPFGRNTLNINRRRWHDRQARITVLDQDVQRTLFGNRAPEPFYIRANSNDCIDYKMTNLIPNVLNLDDFQIFTPTDVVGQHIHLVKFDVTASDGAGNGWNYEDGALSPDEVRERIKANNAFQQQNNGTQILTAQTNNRFGAGPGGMWVGAQTNVSRWWADPLLNNAGVDRTIRTVFTHDHFGPSSHQHHGLYGALVVEKKGSRWEALNGNALYTRPDGGPTSYAANIITPNAKDSFREFNLAFADFALAYTAWPELRPINPPGREKEDLPIAIEPPEKAQPEAISAADPGTQLINYRHEPIPLRIGRNVNGQFVQRPANDPRSDLANVFSSNVHDDPFTPLLVAHEGDRTMVRLIQGAQEEQHVFNLHGFKWLFEPSSPNSGYRNGQQIGISEHFEFELNPVPGANNNPFAENQAFKNKGRNFVDHLYSSAATDNLWDGQWGILRMYQGRQYDPIRLGLPNSEGSEDASKGGTLSTAGTDPVDPIDDQPKAEESIDEDSTDPLLVNPDGVGVLAALPSNLDGEGGTEPVIEEVESSNASESDTLEASATSSSTTSAGGAQGYTDATLTDGGEISGREAVNTSESSGKEISKSSSYNSSGNVCPQGAPPRPYNVSAYLASQLVAGGITYNKRFNIKDPNAIIFVEDAHVAAIQNGTQRVEPLILRAAAGDCITVRFTNRLPTTLPENDSWNIMPPIIPKFNFNQVRTSNRVGLHPQLVSFDPYRHDGANVGFNQDSTVKPGDTKTYIWYAGHRILNRYGNLTRAPVEFGSTNLRDMGDVIKHASHGAIGSLIIEPQSSNWTTVGDSKATADVKNSSNVVLFREFVLHYQDDLTVQQNGQPLRNIGDEDDPEDSGAKAFNYRTEPIWARMGLKVEQVPDDLNDCNLKNVLHSIQPNPRCPMGAQPLASQDPETPIFTAVAGRSVRFRVLHPAGHPRQHGFTLFGHHWNFEPWQNNSTVQGFNPLTFEIGSESGIGPTRHVNILTTAGGLRGISGDFLYRSQESFQFTHGLWGIFRVTAGKAIVKPPACNCVRAPCYCDGETPPPVEEIPAENY